MSLYLPQTFHHIFLLSSSLSFSPPHSLLIRTSLSSITIIIIFIYIYIYNIYLYHRALNVNRLNFARTYRPEFFFSNSSVSLSMCLYMCMHIFVSVESCIPIYSQDFNLFRSNTNTAFLGRVSSLSQSIVLTLVRYVSFSPHHQTRRDPTETWTDRLGRNAGPSSQATTKFIGNRIIYLIIDFLLIVEYARVRVIIKYTTI